MTKTELISAVATASNQTKSVVETILKNAGVATRDALAKGDSVPAMELGIYKPVSREAREGRNPFDGSKIQVPAKRAVKFAASTELKKIINS